MPRRKSKESSDESGVSDTLQIALADINRMFGPGTIMRLNDKPLDIPSIPTGSLGLDIAIGIGGIPRGRLIELYGPESGGKSTLALGMVAQVQKIGGVAAYIDAEHALDRNWAETVGVNTNDMFISQPDNGEQALEIVEALVRHANTTDLVIIDSVAALVPAAELAGDYGDANMGLQARLISQACRMLTAIVHKSDSTIVFINQIREKIGGYGNPETTTGGRALKFYATVRLDIRRIAGGAIKNGEEIIGYRTKVKVVKNKVAPPFKECEFDLMFGEGISHEGELIDVAVQTGVFTRSGAWVLFKGKKIAQGRENARKLLKEDKDLAREVEVAIYDDEVISE